ncbi:hypothetical protein OG2516_16134 [Oceanicola granulosus HTCC2516]|uniref:DUF4336 domain-containing protein n=1 Tax=Oceanicola granulosus (strain ATCC BAA-861 / DSM 15982 / KCTC 12143 / HTCC2516) TaxID=314256 RepID=Q2CGT9_OCEGH|nr:DUF4336 domain-containing protein [Oceanicola granulosus]EAR51846.1 hypothetical protein OG2516_16134 [Oceanicola granulosus HTCC2516]
MGSEARGYPPFDVPKRVADGVWIVDAKPIHAMGLALPARMTVVRLTDGSLWLHSPTPFSPELLARLEELGPVRHLVAPTIGHWKFLQAWQRHCPGATCWAAPNLRRRLQVRASGVRFDHDLGDTPPDDWSSDLRQTVVPGGGGFREVAFFHPPTRTVVLTDLVSNLEPDRVPPATRLYARLTGTRAPEGSTPTYLRASLLLRRRDAAAACGRLVGWEPERVIFAHGKWFETDGARELKRALAWLLDRG